MYLTWLDSNSWLIEIANQHILVDPWLVGPLVFNNLPWLFKSERPTPRRIPEKIDLILLSQGLEDHTHIPTLEKLDHNIPIIASPNAAKIVKKLGYTQITSLTHNSKINIGNELEITALPGSPIGPILVENAYLIKDLTTDKTIYYEPHGFHSLQLQKMAPIDIVITPIIDLSLPLIGPIIKGSKSALELAKMVKPQFILPTAAGGDVNFEGLLISLLQVNGNIEELSALLTENNLTTKVLDVKGGERLSLL